LEAERVAEDAVIANRALREKEKLRTWDREVRVRVRVRC